MQNRPVVLTILTLLLVPVLVFPLHANAQTLPTNPEVESEVSRAIQESAAACGVIGEPSVVRLEIVNPMLGGDRILGEFKAHISIGVMFQGKPRECDMEAAFSFMRTSGGWKFEGIQKKGALPIPAGATPLAEAQARQERSGPTPAQAPLIYPTGPEIESDVRNALGESETACGQIGMPRVLRMKVGTVAAGKDQVVGDAQARLSVDVMFQDKPKECDLDTGFSYIRTSKGWRFQGLNKKGSVAVPAESTPLDLATGRAWNDLAGSWQWVQFWQGKDGIMRIEGTAEFVRRSSDEYAVTNAWKNKGQDRTSETVGKLANGFLSLTDPKNPAVLVVYAIGGVDGCLTGFGEWEANGQPAGAGLQLCRQGRAPSEEIIRGWSIDRAFQMSADILSWPGVLSTPSAKHISHWLGLLKHTYIGGRTGQDFQVPEGLQPGLYFRSGPFLVGATRVPKDDFLEVGGSVAMKTGPGVRLLYGFSEVLAHSSISANLFVNRLDVKDAGTMPAKDVEVDNKAMNGSPDWKRLVPRQGPVVFSFGALKKPGNEFIGVHDGTLKDTKSLAAPEGPLVFVGIVTQQTSVDQAILKPLGQ